MDEEDVYLIAFILIMMIIPQILLLKHIRIIDVRLLQLLSFFSLLTNNVFIIIISIIIFTANLFVS